MMRGEEGKSDGIPIFICIIFIIAILIAISWPTVLQDVPKALGHWFQDLRPNPAIQQEPSRQLVSNRPTARALVTTRASLYIIVVIRDNFKYIETTMDEVEEIRRRIDIVDLISSYLTLKKAGREYKAVCPFHQEKTPSFMISPEKQIFKCFGCGQGGSVFDFVMQMEHLEFREALEMLAERAGVKLKKFKPEPGYKPERKTRLYQINAIAAGWFNKVLLTHRLGKPALNYLLNRSLNVETIKDFQLGFSPSPEVLRRGIKSKGYSDEEIRAAGNPDKFYNRIIFPIRDIMGRTIAFTGRVLDPKKEPKYLNTPDTEIFHKGRILYNLEKARGPIKQENFALVVEGQMDVIASAQAGVKNVVATSGTALTEDHLEILFRYGPNITFCFDSDSAGSIAQKKAYEMALIRGFNVKMVILGEYKDPGEMIAKDPKLWQKAVNDAKPVIDWYFDLAFKNREKLSSQEKKEIAKELLPVIKKIPDTIEQAHYIGVLSKRLEVPEEIIYSVLSKVQDKIKVDAKKSKPDLSAKPRTKEEILLGILASNPKLISKAKQRISEKDLAEDLTKKVYKLAISWYDKDVKQDFSEFLKKYLSSEDLTKVNLLEFEVEKDSSKENLEQEFYSILERMKSDKTEVLKRDFAQKIKYAETQNDRDRLKQLIKEFQDAISQ